MGSIFGTIGGTAYSVLAPTAHIVYRPIAAGTKGIVAGTLWPSVKYTWNGTAWVLTKGNDLPNDDNMIVTFVPENEREFANVDVEEESEAEVDLEQ